MADINTTNNINPSNEATTNTSTSVNTNIDKKTEENKKEDKAKTKKQRRPFKVVMKTWSKGLAKEAGRVTWEKKSNVLRDFVTIVIVCVFFAVIFFAIDMIIISTRKN